MNEKKIQEVAEIFKQSSEFQPEEVQGMSEAKRAELLKTVEWIIKHKVQVLKCELKLTKQQFKENFSWIKLMGQMLENPGDFGIEC